MTFDFSNIYLFTWETLWMYEMENDIGLDGFEKLAENQEISLAQSEKDFHQLVEHDPDLKSMEPQYQGSYYDQIYGRDKRVLEEISQLQRRGLVLSLFSFFEGRLKAVCELIEEEFSFDIKIDDLDSSEHLMQYYNYIIKVYGADKAKFEKYFTPINQQRIIRNKIAHEEAIIPKKSQVHLVNGIQLKPYEDKFLIVIYDIQYILYLITNLRLFFANLLLEIDRRYKELKVK